MKKFIIGLILFLIVAIIIVLGIFKYFDWMQKPFYDKDFDIETYKSSVDKDNDGTDDQTDFLDSVKGYLAYNPKYKSKYYSTGYPDDGYGVCTDVVAFGMRYTGYNIMELLNQDVLNNRESYNIDVVDKNIDFRRVGNLNVYFKNNHISLTTDLSKIEEWQGGDIVVFDGHIGVVSDKRNYKGIPYLIHHASPFQISYEEDAMEYYGEIIGHYRIS